MLLLRKCLSKYSDLLVIDVKKVKANVEYVKAKNAQQLKHLTKLLFDDATKNLAMVSE